ncbi:MAG: hypothetical protein ABIR37_04530 [Candidatus Saccharimonadales bacterium]
MDNMSDAMEADRARLDELNRLDQTGELSEEGRMERDQLRRKVEDSDM